MLAQPDLGDAVGLRDRAMIELMYSTGIRVSELCGIRTSDLSMDPGCLRCTGKGDKEERLVPVGRSSDRRRSKLRARGQTEASWRAHVTVSLRESEGPRPDAHGFLAHPARLRMQGGPAQAAEASHAAAQFCNAPAGPGRRFALCANDAGTFRYFDHADLYARCGRASEAGLGRFLSPARSRRSRALVGGGTASCPITCSCWRADSRPNSGLRSSA